MASSAKEGNKRRGDGHCVTAYLRFDQDQVNEENNKIMLDIFVCEAFASRALSQSDALA
jgi:hypothetical protein